MRVQTAAKRAIDRAPAFTGLIKGNVSTTPRDGLVPGFSASGQDVWVPAHLTDARSPGLVLSSVGARAGRVFLADYDHWGTVANTSAWIPRPGWDIRFLHYFFNREDFWIRGGSAQPYVQEGPSLAQPIPLLEESTQRAIADYLDRETAQIDTLIAEQQRLIELLHERRISVVTRFVTKGTDPDVPLRRSSIEWIGKVPTHWDVKRLRFSVSSAVSGVWGSDPTGDAFDIPCVRVADFDRKAGAVTDSVPTLRSVPAKDQSGRLLRRGDLLLEKSGGTGLNPVGYVAIYEGVDDAAVCANFITRLRPAAGQEPMYWFYAHAAAYSTRLTEKSVKRTTGIQNLDQSSYFDEYFPFPPLEEQRRIVAELDEVTAKIDTLIGEAERFIELAKERRSALITAAVTGQIDIPGVE